MRVRMRMRMAAILLASLCLPYEMRSTTLARLSLDQLTAAADAVARLRCTASDSVWEGGNIWTLTSFDTLEIMKGSVPSHIAVRLPGGHIGGLKSVVEGAPQFKAGDEAVVFLERSSAGAFSIAGWVQGTFRVKRDVSGTEVVTQDSSAFSIFDPSTRAFRTEGIRRMPMEKFRIRVSDATSQTREKRP